MIDSEKRLLNGLAYEEVLAFTQELIAIPSHQEHPRWESSVASKIADKLCSEGIKAELVPVAPNRYNIIAQLEGSGGGPTLLFNAHLDTVPPYDMPEPFTPTIKEGRLYGRGAVDVKAMLSSMCYTLITLHRLGISLRGKVIFAGVADEESGSLGTRQLIKNLSADMAIVGEPTELAIGVAHKGVEWVELEFQGRAAHGGVPSAGVNAIYQANLFLDVLQQRLLPALRYRVHSLVGPSTLNVGLIQGGNRPTIVPDHCLIQLDRRWIPTETRSQALAEIDEITQELKQKASDFNCHWRTILGDETRNFPALCTPIDSPVVQALQTVTERVLGSASPIVGLPYWTDAALVSKIAGIPSVVLGPGNIEQAHSNEEYVEIEQIYQAAEIYLLTAYHLCY